MQRCSRSWNSRRRAPCHSRCHVTLGDGLRRCMTFVGGERVPLAGVRELMEQYVAAFKQSESKGCAGRDEPLYGAIKRVYVAESDDAARERARLAYASYRTHFLKPLPGGRVDPD